VGRYIARRALEALPLLLLVSIILFGMIQLTGDPLAAYTVDSTLTGEDLARLRHFYGLDQPMPIQYLRWLANLLTGNWGTSFVSNVPVAQLIAQRLPNTLLLVFSAYSIILIVALVVGTYTAVHQYSPIDHLFTTLAFIGISVPSFWLGLLLLIFFAVQTRNLGLPYFPAGGMYDLAIGPSLPQIAWHLVLPSVTLATVVVASYIRYVRASMLEVIRQDYVRTARAKGLSEAVLLRRHAFKNAAIPLVTLIALDLPRFLSGSVVVESIFAWPGMGRLFWDEAQRTDIPVLMAVLMFTSVLVVVFNLLADIVYAFLDPRIRYR
jgi:peptide/nickel transport system permease protein